MARIGVFALNLSPKTGGVYSLIDGLMVQAHRSEHEFLYLSQLRPGRADLPSNVELLTRPAAARLATQIAFRVPGVGRVLRHRGTAVAALSALCGLSPRLFTSVDAWLWPHCFAPVPRLDRLAVICHDMIHRRHPEHFGRFDLARRRQAEKALPDCAAVLCPSEASAADLRLAYPDVAPRVRLFSEAPCEVLPAALCAEEARELDQRYGDVPLFLFVAVDWPHKNHELLIDAALELRRRTTLPFRVVFVGHRRGTAVEAAIVRKGALGVVEDVGAVSRPMLAAYYRRAVALAFPSLCEGFGIPLVEAMQYGLPILASDRSCVPEVCGGAAVLLPVTSRALWAEHMGRLLVDEGRRASLAAAARARGQAFNWTRTWREVDQALALALARPDARGTGVRTATDAGAAAIAPASTAA